MKNVNATLETYSEITEVDGSYAIVVSTLLPILVLFAKNICGNSILNKFKQLNEISYRVTERCYREFFACIMLLMD